MEMHQVRYFLLSAKSGIFAGGQALRRVTAFTYKCDQAIGADTRCDHSSTEIGQT